ncbi:transglutaminase-like domain-containing protein [Lyngbya sp. CCY1209]|uniref:SirB1 family protein n=1 Tax=Lyngbya sp. CCY1209 TaxID=2886103 RepID=UPI002D201243|nr:transglutaminase-like domain-containing protein [Lyngbya sp. CCY1209]MEB3884896.1 transglutaminase-like domain-containing protein [Lyngbya sp. CCY1209]
MDGSLAKQHFHREVSQPDGQIDLAKAALYMAQEYQPPFEVDAYLNALDTMATEVSERLPESRYPLRVIRTINRYLFEDLGFRGNRTQYYDPENSFLNRVIDRRTGIPIALSLVYLEVARRVDFPMVGIGMPGHFLIRPEFEDAGIYVDVFEGGEILFPQDCEARLSQVYGQPVKLQPEFLNPVDNRRFLGRMLQNLKVIYMNGGTLEAALQVVEQMLLLYPDAITQRRDRGILCYQLGRRTEARRDLQDYLDRLPTARDAGIIRQLLDRMDSDI